MCVLSARVRYMTPKSEKRHQHPTGIVKYYGDRMSYIATLKKTEYFLRISQENRARKVDFLLKNFIRFTIVEYTSESY